MPISIATPVVQADETYGFDNLSPLAGSWRNFFWDQVGATALVWGRQFGKFNFDFVRVNIKFENLTPTMPADALITSAVLRGTAQATSDALDFFSIVRTLTRDGIWVPPATSGWQTASTVSGPHGTLRTAAKVVVRNVIFGELADTGISTTNNWPIRDNANSRGLRAGQGVDIVTGGTLGFVEIEIDKDGTGGAGDIWAEIYTQDANGLADTLIATSVVRPASDAPATPGLLIFAFTGPEQIALSAAQKIVVDLNGDYPLSGVNNVGMRWTAHQGAGGYPAGTFQLDGIGRAFNDQNYPTQRTFQNVPGDGFVIWIAPQFFVGVDYDTPELASMLQNHIDVSGYVEGDPFAFSVERSLFLSPAATATRRWASTTHGTFGPVRLIIEWQERVDPRPTDGIGEIINAISGESRLIGIDGIAALSGALDGIATVTAELDGAVELVGIDGIGTAIIETVHDDIDGIGETIGGIDGSGELVGIDGLAELTGIDGIAEVGGIDGSATLINAIDGIGTQEES